MRFLAERIHPHLRQNGLEEFVSCIDSEEQNLLFRTLVAIDRRFLGYIQFMRDWVAFERRLADEGITDVCRDFFRYFGLKVECGRLPAEFKSPGNPAIMLGMNHEAIIEPLVLASLLNREDIKFIGMKVFQYLGPNISEMVLPVLPKKVAVDYPTSKKSTFSSKFDIILDLYRLESMSLEEIEKQNDSSFREAANHLANGGVLIIFPNGGRDIKKQWYRGIGQLIGLLAPEIAPTTPIFPIRTSGISRKLLVKKARQAANGQPKKVVANVKIYDPIYLPIKLSGVGPDEILEYLRSMTLDRINAAEEGGPQAITFDPTPVASSYHL